MDLTDTELAATISAGVMIALGIVGAIVPGAPGLVVAWLGFAGHDPGFFTLRAAGRSEPAGHRL
jgi:uncharacterized protein YqgC (DUF456 family)